MTTQWESPQTLQALAEGASVVTANLRQARALRALYARRRIADGAQSWESPDILPWDAWLRRLADAVELPLLTPEQEHALWLETLGAALPASDAAQARIAEMAAQAWELCHEWELSDDDDETPESEEARAFRLWRRDFAARCDRLGRIDNARLATTLAARAARLPLPARALLYGFAEQTPQRSAVVAALRAAGCDLREAPPAQTAAPAAQIAVMRAELADGAAEIAAAARWARARLEADPEARIGIVHPDLGEWRPLFERLFEETLLPGAALRHVETRERPFNLSLPPPLAEWPLAHAALLALERWPMALDRLGALLRSPFVRGARAERQARGRLDRALRRRGEPRVAHAVACAEAQANGCPQLRAALETLRQRRAATPRRQGFPRWARDFAAELDALGWPGERLDSVARQTHAACREALDALHGIGAVGGETTRDEALRRLRRIFARRRFQPGGGAAPIHILGLLEGAGLAFDHLWVMGLHDGAWPRPPRPHPFLSLRAQRAAGTPHASAERETAFAERLAAGFRRAAREVVFSSPLHAREERLHPSPQLLDLPLRPPPAAAQATPYRVLLYRARQIEEIADAVAPPLPCGSAAAGGAGLLEAQSACPFRAFARYRLRARALEEAETGLDAMRRGQLVHQALETAWRRLEEEAAAAGETGGQAYLQAQDPHEALRALIADSVARTLARAQRQAPGLFTAPLLQLEAARLERLTGELLALDRLRPPFIRVRPEERHEIDIGGLTLTLRIDRIDEGDDGRRTLIDYKTGADANPEQWLGERPAAPQLPLYATWAQGRPASRGVAAALYGRVRAEGVAYDGIAAHDGEAMRMRVEGESTRRRRTQRYGDWERLLAEWRVALTRLAEEHRAGRAEIAPAPATCRHCDLEALCRHSAQPTVRFTGSNAEIAAVQ